MCRLLPWFMSVPPNEGVVIIVIYAIGRCRLPIGQLNSDGKIGNSALTGINLILSSSSR